jgi:hypothetical protein
MTKNVILTLLLVVMIVSPVMAQDSFRCGREVISNGYSTARVLQNCGPPSYREIINPGINGARVEKWYYDCGDTGFLYSLRFVDGTLETIKNEGPGRGRSECTGDENR